MKIVIPRIIYNQNQLEWDWSGTVTNLKKSLRKYAVIEEKNYELTFSDKLIRKLRKKFLKYDDLNLSIIEKANKKLKNRKGIFLNFDEFPLKQDTDNMATYIYQDLCVEYLLDILENDNDLFKYSGFSTISEIALRKRRESQKKYYNSVNNVFTMSTWLKEYMVKNKIVEEDKITHVGGGLNISSDTISSDEKSGNKFLFVGKDFDRKAGDLVYKAFLELEKEESDIELYIIGPKKLPFEISSERVHFLGEIPSGQISKYFNLCDYFVMPSRFEAYGLVFIEALTYGLPCIGRRLHEMPYLIDENETGFLIEKNEEDEKVLAEYMKKLMHSEEIKRNVRNKRDYYIETYSWDAVAKRMLGVIEVTSR